MSLKILINKHKQAYLQPPRFCFNLCPRSDTLLYSTLKGAEGLNAVRFGPVYELEQPFQRRKSFLSREDASRIQHVD